MGRERGDLLLVATKQFRVNESQLEAERDDCVGGPVRIGRGRPLAAQPVRDRRNEGAPRRHVGEAAGEPRIQQHPIEQDA